MTDSETNPGFLNQRVSGPRRVLESRHTLVTPTSQEVGSARRRHVVCRNLNFLIFMKINEKYLGIFNFFEALFNVIDESHTKT